jgi:hypothetical protein
MENLKLKKSKFAHYLHQFQCNYPYQIRLIEFPAFPPSENESLILSQPGVYGIHCFGTDSTLITHALDIFYNLDKDFRELEFRKLGQYLYEGPEKFIKDYDMFGSDLDYFLFIIFSVGPEWTSFEKRSQEVERIKSFWSYNLYDPF